MGNGVISSIINVNNQRNNNGVSIMASIMSIMAAISASINQHNQRINNMASKANNRKCNGASISK
jgi:hypothetical protein